MYLCSWTIKQVSCGLSATKHKNKYDTSSTL